MLLSITTTYRPATDLGFLLAKHPDKMQSFTLGFGHAHIVYPEATHERCTATLILDLDPVALVRGRPGGGRDGNTAGPLATYVNDRPYVASSFMSVAIGRVLGSALGGRTTARPDLVAADLPLSVTIGPVRVRGGATVIERLFDPLGYAVTAEPVLASDGSPGQHWMLTLAAETRLQALLTHLYVLIPVLDDDKHYWVADDELDKLLHHGEGWLVDHPDRDFITRRYLRHGRGLVNRALAQLAALDADPAPPPDPATADPPAADPPAAETPSLNDLRHQTVRNMLLAASATSVLDLGCGEGRLLRHLLKDRSITRLTGVDLSSHSLAIAHERLNVDRLPDRDRDRLTLLQSALTYRDRRLAGYDAAALVEVVEHVEPDRLPAFEQAVFAHARPRTVVLTTPNRDWNATIPALSSGRLRHADHRFEWTRDEFATWTGRIADSFGYDVALHGIGEAHPSFGCPTQMAVFQCS